MESQPENLEFKNNYENFTNGIQTTAALFINFGKQYHSGKAIVTIFTSVLQPIRLFMFIRNNPLILFKSN